MPPKGECVGWLTSSLCTEIWTSRGFFNVQLRRFNPVCAQRPLPTIAPSLLYPALAMGHHVVCHRFGVTKSKSGGGAPIVSNKWRSWQWYVYFVVVGTAVGDGISFPVGGVGLGVMVGGVFVGVAVGAGKPGVGVCVGGGGVGLGVMVGTAVSVGKGVFVAVGTAVGVAGISQESVVWQREHCPESCPGGA